MSLRDVILPFDSPPEGIVEQRLVAGDERSLPLLTLVVHDGNPAPDGLGLFRPEVRIMRDQRRMDSQCFRIWVESQDNQVHPLPGIGADGLPVQRRPRIPFPDSRETDQHTLRPFFFLREESFFQAVTF